MSDKYSFLTNAITQHQANIKEEGRFGWGTLITGVVVYLLWLLTGPSLSLALLGLMLMWVMRLLHEMRKIQLMQSSFQDVINAQNAKIIMLLESGQRGVDE